MILKTLEFLDPLWLGLVLVILAGLSSCTPPPEEPAPAPRLLVLKEWTFPGRAGPLGRRHHRHPLPGPPGQSAELASHGGHRTVEFGRTEPAGAFHLLRSLGRPISSRGEDGDALPRRGPASGLGTARPFRR